MLLYYRQCGVVVIPNFGEKVGEMIDFPVLDRLSNILLKETNKDCVDNKGRAIRLVIKYGLRGGRECCIVR